MTDTMDHNYIHNQSDEHQRSAHHHLKWIYNIHLNKLLGRASSSLFRFIEMSIHCRSAEQSSTFLCGGILFTGSYAELLSTNSSLTNFLSFSFGNFWWRYILILGVHRTYLVLHTIKLIFWIKSESISKQVRPYWKCSGSSIFFTHFLTFYCKQKVSLL